MDNDEIIDELSIFDLKFENDNVLNAFSLFMKRHDRDSGDILDALVAYATNSNRKILTQSFISEFIELVDIS
uniref:DNA polymerase alpha subunit B n=1 Tax=Panagrolaimus sp. PS1159 TaxID=55785 RepID=A0AC35GJR6_9BILA